MWIFSFLRTVCWRDCPFPIECFWHSCQKSFDHIHECLFLGPLFCSVGLFVCLCTSATLFDYSGFVIDFESESMRPSILFFFFKIVSAIRGPLKFYMNFRMNFSILEKIAIGILIGILLNFRSLWVVWTFLTILKFSYPWPWDVFPFICAFFNFFWHFW